MAKPRVLFHITNGTTREEWLKARRSGIGSSDAAAVCGLSRYRSPLAVWLDKTGGAAVEKEMPEAVTWGNRLEAPIADEFKARTGFKVAKRNAILQSATHPFMLCNVDRLLRDWEEPGYGVLEVKAVGAFKADEWEDGKAPDEYVIQLAHSLAVCDLDYGYLAALIGGQRLVTVKIERDKRLEKWLIEEERKFWKLVETRTPPPIDDSKDATEALKFLYPKGTGESVEIDEADYTSLVAAKQRLIDVEKEVRLYENRIKDTLKTADYGLVKGQDKPVVTWRVSTSAPIDVTALEEAEPEIAAKYRKVRESRRFLVK